MSATLLLHGLPISGGKDGSVCLWDANAPNSPLVVLEAGGPVHALQLLQERGGLRAVPRKADSRESGGGRVGWGRCEED